MINYAKHSISNDDIEAVVDVLKNKSLTQGGLSQVFENQLIAKVNCKYSLAVNSATSALHLACLALNLRPSDWLWTTPISFVASANCGLYCGSQVDFVDIDPNTGLMSVELLALKLESASKQDLLPKIVVPVHLGGTSCDMKAIFELSKKYGFHIVEDASHAIGASYCGIPVGSCQFSDITIFSFHPAKIITTAEGGALCTNSQSIARRARLLSSHGIEKDKSSFIHTQTDSWVYEQQFLGFNYRLSDLQAALGVSQLQRLDLYVATRNNIHDYYLANTKEANFRFLDTPYTCYSSRHLSIIRLKDTSDEFHRYVFDNLRSKGIFVQLHYLPIHLQPYYRNLGFNVGDFPCSEAYAKNAISLPIYPDLQQVDQEFVINSLAELTA